MAKNANFPMAKTHNNIFDEQSSKLIKNINNLSSFYCIYRISIYSRINGFIYCANQIDVENDVPFVKRVTTGLFRLLNDKRICTSTISLGHNCLQHFF